MKAIDTFDVSKKAAFNTHLTNYLKKLFRFVSDNQNIAKIPEQRIRKINLFQIETAKLEDRLGREPTEAELADSLAWSIKEVHRMKKELSRAEILEFGEDSSYADLGINSNAVQRALSIVYTDASPEEKYILEYTTNIVNNKKHKSVTDIAKKLKLSESRVRIMINDINSRILQLL